jgi:micrococcal nuclease
MKKLFFVMMIIIISCTVVYAENERIPVKYIKTSDGDTARFEIDGKSVRVRFLGVNTPEVAGENKTEEPYGNEAMAYTKNKLDNATNIEIEYDKNADKEDRFGRILAYIWVDGELFQEELVRNGYAKTYMIKSNYKYADELKQAERNAKTDKKGVWSEEIEPNLLKENTVESDLNNSVEKNDNEVITYENNENSIITFVIIILVLIVVAVFFTKSKEN